MSYADKHRHQAPCTAPSCPELATTLVLIASKPYWMCDIHARANASHQPVR